MKMSLLFLLLLPLILLLLFSAHILPPWASTIFFDMYKPSPNPMSSDFVVNFKQFWQHRGTKPSIGLGFSINNSLNPNAAAYIHSNNTQNFLNLFM